MADQADRPLAEKLGIESGMVVSIFNAPNYFDVDFEALPDDVEVNRDAEDSPADLFLIFADRTDEAQRGFERAITNMSPDGVIWFAWPHESSDPDSDITPETLQEQFEPFGLTSDGSSLIHQQWMGLRFVAAEGSS